MAIGIVLIEPEIPQNTGNIARTCAATGAALHLVGKKGFSIEDKYVKRAGLDYWDKVCVFEHDTFEQLHAQYPNHAFYFCSTHAKLNYADVCYPKDCFLVFGKETAGLPRELLQQNLDTCIRIPMQNNIRSLNLANSVAIVLYEVLRQQGFEGFMLQGDL